jgi:hypothetical protein
MPKDTFPAAGSGLPENIIPFPLNPDPLDFKAIDLNIDPAKQEQKWSVAYDSAQIAIRFCQLDHLQAEDAVRQMLERNPEIFEEMIEYHEMELSFLEGVLAAMQEGGYRMRIAFDRVQAKRRA